MTPHPLPTLTTYELTSYRRELEHALTAIPAQPRSAPCCAPASAIPADADTRKTRAALGLHRGNSAIRHRRAC